MLQIRRFSRNISFYDILGVKPSCNQEDIKLAFYAKSKLYHPDITNSPMIEDDYKAISLAYNTLSNENDRKLYDMKNNYNICKNEEENSEKYEYFWTYGARIFRERSKFKCSRQKIHENNSNFNYSNRMNSASGEQPSYKSHSDGTENKNEIKHPSSILHLSLDLFCISCVIFYIIFYRED